MGAQAASVSAAVSTAGRRARWADVTLAWVAWGVVLVSVLQVALLAFGRDQGIYALIGGGLLEGQVPYRDLWDFKPPGIFAVYALAELLFGRSMASVRVLEVVGIFAMTLAFMSLSRELTGRRVVGLLAGALAALIHAQLEFWHSGQPESFAGFLTVFGLLLTVRGRFATSSRARAAMGVLVGLCFGLAFLMKPPLGGGAIVCAAYLSRAEILHSGSKRAAIGHWFSVGVASVVPIALTLAWFAWVGGARALAWTMLDFVPGYTALSSEPDALAAFYHGFQEAFTGFSAVLPAGAIAAVALPPVHSREREGLLLLLGVICFQIAGIAMQGKFFQYHYGATLPLIAFIAAVGLYKLWRRAAVSAPAGPVMFFSAMWGLGVMRTAVRTNPGTFWERTEDRTRFLVNRDRKGLEARLYRVADYDLAADRSVAEYLREVTRPSDAVYVWGFEPVIYWISEREPSSRYIYDVPQRTTWNRAQARAELLSDLDRRPPAAIVVQHGDSFHWVTGDSLDSAEALETFPELERRLEDEYRLARTIQDFDVYLRVSPKGS